MFTKDEMKKKYAAEFNQRGNYDKIMRRKNTQQLRQTLLLASLILVCSFVMPQFFRKIDHDLVSDEAQQELGVEIVLNINLPSEEEMKIMDIAQALPVNVQINHQLMMENQSIFSSEICPAEFQMSDIVRMTMLNKETGEEVMVYDCVEMTSESKSIRLMYAYDQYPFRCSCLGPEQSVSVLDGTEMIIFHRPDLNLYLCLFQIGNIYFDVETSGISENELIDFLLELVNEVRCDT